MKTLITSLIITTALFLATSALAHPGQHDPLSGHLAYKNNSLHIHASFPTQPIVGTEALLILEAKDAKTHQPTELNDQVEVVLWMPSMGHGSAPTHVEPAVNAQGEIMTGVFNVSQVYFIMAGEWEVRVTLTDLNGQKETKSFRITLDNNNDHGHHH